MKDDTSRGTAPTGSVDWASASHVGAVVDHEGVLVEHRQVDHTSRGLARLVAMFARRGVTRVAIERPDGPVVEALLDAGLTVFVVHPRQLKHLRSR